MKFLIQTIDGVVKHDFSFVLIEAIEYQNWYTRTDVCKYFFGPAGVFLTNDFVDNPKEWIPVGSVEFVSDYMNKYFGKRPKPINIPLSLFKPEYLRREVFLGNEKEISGKKFVKSLDRIKGYTEIVDDTIKVPEGQYLISELIEIESEWRAFVYKERLVGLQNYTGDFTIFPDVKIIKKMIRDYEDQPVAFTLDVGITDKGETVIIEAHDFFSCGLYGFSDARILPNMFSSWFQEFTR